MITYPQWFGGHPAFEEDLLLPHDQSARNLGTTLVIFAAFIGDVYCEPDSRLIFRHHSECLADLLTNSHHHPRNR